MITQLTLNYDIPYSMNAFVVEESLLPSAGDKIKVYIPKFMSKMGKPSKAETEIVPLQTSNMLFINDKSCRPTVNNTVNTQNYIEATVKNQASWNKKSIKTKTDDTGTHNYIKKDAKGICECPNNLLKIIYFSDNVNSGEVFSASEYNELESGNGIKIDNGKISVSGEIKGKIISQEDDDIVIKFE